MDVWFYRLVRPLVKAFFYVVYRPIVIGKENIPKEKRVVLAGNHSNNMDCIFLIATNKRTVHFLAKDELLKSKFGFIFKAMGIIPVNRREKDHTALPMAIKELNKDHVIGIFPEGTFNDTDDVIRPFKIGAVKMAHDTGSVIVPFAITGKYRPFRERMKIIYDKPYEMTCETLDLENEKLMNKVRYLLTKRGN